MRRFVEMGDPFVHPVHGDAILNQIVGADAKEVDLARQFPRAQRRAGHFDHDADGHFLVERVALLAQFGLALFEQFVGLPHLFQPADERVHQLHVAERARAQDRTQLHLENIRVLQTKADGAATQKRVQLGRQVQVADGLVPAEVERADDDRVRQHLARHLTIVFVLFLLVGQAGFVQVEKLRPVQTHAFRAAGFHHRDVFGQLDVGG